MRYRFDWSCKEWRDFSARAEVEPVSGMEWWTEYSKYHRFFDNEKEFLEQAECALEAILQDDFAGVATALSAITLLRKGNLKNIQFNDLELSVWEDAK